MQWVDLIWFCFLLVHYYAGFKSDGEISNPICLKAYYCITDFKSSQNNGQRLNLKSGSVVHIVQKDKSGKHALWAHKHYKFIINLICHFKPLDFYNISEKKFSPGHFW